MRKLLLNIALYVLAVIVFLTAKDVKPACEPNSLPLRFPGEE